MCAYFEIFAYVFSIEGERDFSQTYPPGIDLG